MKFVSNLLIVHKSQSSYRSSNIPGHHGCTLQVLAQVLVQIQILLLDKQLARLLRLTTLLEMRGALWRFVRFRLLLPLTRLLVNYVFLHVG